jgi:hypothetical protein
MTYGKDKTRKRDNGEALGEASHGELKAQAATNMAAMVMQPKTALTLQL